MTHSARGAYDGLGAREGSARGDGNIEGRLGLLQALVPWPGGQLLDIGCGNGAYTLRMVCGFDHAVGLDIEPDRLQDFRDTMADAAVTVLECSATKTPYDAGAFDAVTAIETMEHLADNRASTVREMARVLKPGGTFYLTTPNRWWPMEQHGFIFRGTRQPGWRFPFLTWVPTVHRRFSVDDAFTPARLDRIVEPHGFRRSGLAYMWPPLDNHPRFAAVARPLLNVLQRSPLRRFAQTLVMTYQRI